MNETPSLFLSPPVARHAGSAGFTISIEVDCLCTGRVEWGFQADALTYTAISASGGLIDADDECLMIPAHFDRDCPPAETIYYRVVAQSLNYQGAYDVSQGPCVATAVRRLKIPRRTQPAVSLAVVNDTHGRADTVAVLARRVESLDPDLLVWNGDVCRSFDADDNPASVLLRPGQREETPSAGGWASTRPLLYVPGNHDVRGEKARCRPFFFAPGDVKDLPYNMARRIGPLALITLDSGEDKPDRHPVFGGTTAYEPYRYRQAAWLSDQLSRPEIASAPFKLAFSHIPLRGLSGDNDGTTLKGYAHYSGQGSKLWLPRLIEGGFQAIISGHTHVWRVDEPTNAQPITQIVGGGPDPAEATVIVITATPRKLTTRVQNPAGDILASKTWETER